MPVKLPQRTLVEMQLSARDVSARRKIGHDLFAQPSSRENPVLGVGEAPLEVGDHAVVRGLRAEIVRVL